MNSHDPLQASTSEPIPKLGNIPPSPSQSHDNLDLPITQRKGVRTCTQHPMSNFVSFHALSLFFFNASIGPCPLFLSLTVYLKNAMVEEMQALEIK